MVPIDTNEGCNKKHWYGAKSAALSFSGKGVLAASVFGL